MSGHEVFFVEGARGLGAEESRGARGGGGKKEEEGGEWRERERS